MKFFKTALMVASVFAASAFAGFYADLGTGLTYSYFQVEDKPYYVSKTDAGKTYSDSSANTVKVDSDRQKFTGIGPGFDLKVGYAWEYGALFGDFGLSMGYGSHEGEDYFVVEDCAYAKTNAEKCIGHEKYELQQSSSTRFTAAAGFMLTPFGGTEAMSRMSGFYFGASCGFSLVETSTDDSEYANHRSTLSDLGLGLQVEIGQKWLIAGRWDTGFSIIGSWDFPARYSDGIAPESYYTIGAQIHVSRH